MTPFVTQFGTVVTAVQTAYDDGGKPFYDYGHPSNIVNRLLSKLRDASTYSKRFPAIFLFQDFAEERQKDLSYLIPSCTVIIAASTKPHYSEAERYTKNFVPTLYPLYDLLIEAIKTSNVLEWYPEEVRKIDRVYWGKSGLYGNDGNIFNDYIDAIEIEFRNLINLKTC